MIKPTVGRIVWFYQSRDQTEPLAGIVAKVWSDTAVNLMVVQADGSAKVATSVPLMQEGDAYPIVGYFATWMPYQIGQAKKDVASS